MIVINAAMAHQLNEFKSQIDKLVNGGMEQEEALYKVLKETIIASQNIRFEGDGYSEEWKAEAARPFSFNSSMAFFLIRLPYIPAIDGRLN